MVNTALTGNVRGALGGDISVQNGIGPFNEQQLSIFANLKANGTLTQYTAVVDTQVQAVVNGQAQRFELFAVDPSVFPLAGAARLQQPQQRLAVFSRVRQYGSGDRLPALPARAAQGRSADG